jgi:hypothetical protein
MLPCRPRDSREVIARQGARRRLLVLRTAVTQPGPPSRASRSRPELWLRASSVFSRLAGATERNRSQRRETGNGGVDGRMGQRLLRRFARIRSFCLRGSRQGRAVASTYALCGRSAARVKRVGSGRQRGWKPRELAAWLTARSAGRKWCHPRSRVRPRSGRWPGRAGRKPERPASRSASAIRRTVTLPSVGVRVLSTNATSNPARRLIPGSLTMLESE